MANRQLTPEELRGIASPLLMSIRESLIKFSGGDAELLFALRRKVAKELMYDERGKPKAIDGLPAEITPLADFNFDKAQLKLDQLIRSGIEPKIFGIEYYEVKCEKGSALKRLLLVYLDSRYGSNCGPEWFQFKVSVTFVHVGRGMAGELHADFLCNARVGHCRVKAMPQTMECQ